jgi:hypothetical protein
MQPGGGYAPHVDAYDVAILVLEGTVETLGQTCGPNTVIFYAAGESHGMRNVGPIPARYIVWEFHAPGTKYPGRRVSLLQRIVRQYTSPQSRTRRFVRLMKGCLRSVPPFRR